MADFSDIQSSFARYSEAESKYWDDLQSKAWKVFVGLEQHLGLVGKTFTLPGKKSEPYLQAGNLDEGEFVPVNGPFFTCIDMRSEFVIRLVVDAAPDATPKKGILILASIGKESGAYDVSFNVRDGVVSVPIPEAFPAEELRALYDRMVFEVIHTMDTSIFK